MSTTFAERHHLPSPVRRRSDGTVGGSRPPGRLLIVQRSLRDRRRGLAAWAVGIGAYVGLITAFWPAIRDNSEITDAIKNYPDAMKELFGGVESFDFSQPGNYLNGELFSLMAPLLLGVFAIGLAAGTLAGEEQGGQLDLLLSTPVSRRRVVAEKAITLVIGVMSMTVVAFVTVAGIGALVGLDVRLSHLAAACAGSGLVALVYGSLAFAVGAATGSRAVAIGVASAAFAAGYLFQVLSGLVDGMRWSRLLSALYVANGTVPVNHGVPVARDLLLVVVILVILAAGVMSFERRDISA